MNRDREKLDLLHQHISAGKLTGGHQERLKKLMELADPEDFTEVSEAWRVVALSDEDYSRLKDGSEITLDGRDHECWTRDRNGIRELMRTRMSCDPECHLVVMKRDFPAGTGFLDIEKMAISMNYQESHPIAWVQYGSLEKEILLKNPGGISRVKPEDVSEGLDVPLTEENVFMPRVGESFFYSPTEEMFEIREEAIGWNDEKQAWVFPDEGRFVYVTWESGLSCFFDAVDEPELDIDFRLAELELTI